jgi:membrane-bound ClpP family serine protease
MHSLRLSGIRILIEEIKQINESKKDLKKFGLTVGIVLLILGVLLFFRGKNSNVYFGITGIILLFSAFFVPVILKPLNKIWMILAILLGWITTRVILIILFYFAITPISILSKIFKKDFLDRKIDKSKNSYWQKREEKSSGDSDYEKQF